MASRCLNKPLHHDIGHVWQKIGQDRNAGVVIVTGAGDYFSAGGAFHETKKMPRDYDFFIEMIRDARELVENKMPSSDWSSCR